MADNKSNFRGGTSGNSNPGKGSFQPNGSCQAYDREEILSAPVEAEEQMTSMSMQKAIAGLIRFKQ